jgi:hypothetical protein
MKFKNYVTETIDTDKIENIYSKLMESDFIESQISLDEFREEVKKIIHDGYEEHTDPAHIIAGYAKPILERDDLELLLSKIHDTIEDKIVNPVRPYHGVNLGRLEVIVERMVKEK